MASIVAGIGLPHSPGFPSHVARRGEDCEEAVLYRELETRLVETRPDLIVMLANDHFNTFFLDNFPLIAVGAASATSGPNDFTPMPNYEVRSEEQLALDIRRSLIRAEFDVAITQEFTLDHAFMVPWHFICSRLAVPMIPIFIDCFSDPLPRAKRMWDFGLALRAAISALPDNIRVAVVASGNFSLEIGGPLTAPNKRSSAPDKAWAAAILQHIRSGTYEALVEAATEEQIARAGNAAGELLNWIAMISAAGGGVPIFIQPQIDHGHAFGFWSA
jgi:aromatic ring-opening dioxygenase catalytic subunit (LigB family)